MRFIQACCVHPEGDLVGQPLILHPWWRQRLYELLELMPRHCPLCNAVETFAGRDEAWVCTTCGGWLEELPPDERRYSEGYISTAKKSAKSTVVAALGLFLLVDDNDDAALGICAATTEKQSANLMFGSARYMVENSPTLSDLIEPYQDEIRVKGTRSRLRNVTSAVGTNDGPIIKFVLADELHEWRGQRGRDLFTVLSKGCTRRNALFLSVTTAGFDEDSICYERYSYGRKVAAGEVDDQRFYFYCAELPAEADHHDKSLWHIANPLLGVTPTESYLETQLLRNPESAFRRYNLNQWVAGEEIWIPYGVWDEGRSDRQFTPDLPLYVGIDMAKNIDATAVAMVQVHPTDDPERPIYVVRARIWENPFPEGDSRRAGWRMNNHEVMQLCRELFVQYPKPAIEVERQVKVGPAFCFDPWRFRTEADMLSGEGLAMVEVPQTDVHMIPASQGLFEAIINRQIAHDGDPALKRHIHNTTARARERGWRIDRPEGARRPNDATVALAIALDQAKQGAPQPVGIMWV